METRSAQGCGAADAVARPAMATTTTTPLRRDLHWQRGGSAGCGMKLALALLLHLSLLVLLHAHSSDSLQHLQHQSQQQQQQLRGGGNGEAALGFAAAASSSSLSSNSVSISCEYDGGKVDYVDASFTNAGENYLSFLVCRSSELCGKEKATCNKQMPPKSQGTIRLPKGWTYILTTFCANTIRNAFDM